MLSVIRDFSIRLVLFSNVKITCNLHMALSNKLFMEGCYIKTRLIYCETSRKLKNHELVSSCNRHHAITKLKITCRRNEQLRRNKETRKWPSCAMISNLLRSK